MIERFKVQGVDLRSSTPAEFKDHLNKEEKRWVTLIKEQGIKPELQGVAEADLKIGKRVRPASSRRPRT